MTPDEAPALLTRLLGRIAPDVDVDRIDPDAPLTEVADLDSMDFLNLVTAVHDETGIEVPERAYPEISTVSGFVAHLAAPAERAG